MKVRVEVSSYIQSSYNNAKLDKLKAELEKVFSQTQERPGYPEEGVCVEILMSAKYGTPYIKVSEWGNYQAIGQLEDLVKEALENRCLEVSDEEHYYLPGEGEQDYFKIDFE